MDFLKSITQTLAERTNPSHPPIVLTQSGFMTGAKSATEVQWKDIKEVRAFKLDLVAWDEVRFVFFLFSGVAVEVSEEQPGFEAMLTEAMHHMPSMTGWQSAIINPAFARNETVLFPR